MNPHPVLPDSGAADLVAGADAWTATAQVWLLVLLVGLGLAAVAALWVVALRVARLARGLDRLDVLDEIDATVRRLAEAQADLDLRRLEHVLIDLRDGQKRVEDALLRVVEAAASQRERAAAGAQAPERPRAGLAERVVNRLLALGYERIQVVTRHAELEALHEGDGDGEVLVEARRDGAPCKGRVIVRAGAIVDVELKPAYTIFP